MVSYTELGNNHKESIGGDKSTKSDWHTSSVLNKASQDAAINAHEIATRSEFSDWYILSSSVASMYTYDSTFASSARRRAGYFRTRHDFHVKAGEGKDGKMTCEPVRQMSTYCDLCADKLTGPAGSSKKSPCPMEIQTDCAAGIVTEHSSTATSPLSTSSPTTSTSSPSLLTTLSSNEVLSSPTPPVVSPTSNINTKTLQEYESVIADLKTRIAHLEAKDKDKDKDKDKPITKGITNED